MMWFSIMPMVITIICTIINHTLDNLPDDTGAIAYRRYELQAFLALISLILVLIAGSHLVYLIGKGIL